MLCCEITMMQNSFIARMLLGPQQARSQRPSSRGAEEIQGGRWKLLEANINKILLTKTRHRETEGIS